MSFISSFEKMELSERDKTILNCVFNPHLPLEEAIEENSQELQDVEEWSEVLEDNKNLEIEAIKLSESGKLNEGLKLINQAIEQMPHRPSLYNNRACIYQYRRQFEDALQDLTKAIELSLSAETATKTLCRAYCQRGLLHRRFENVEMARNDFTAAAKLGDKFAKAQLVELNPYAALCNQMLRQVIEKLN